MTKTVTRGDKRAVLEVRRTGTVDWNDASADEWGIPLIILCGTVNFVSWRLHRKGWTLRVTASGASMSKTRFGNIGDALDAQREIADQISRTT